MALTWVGFSVVIIVLLTLVLAAGIWMSIALMATGMAGLYLDGGLRTFLALGSIAWNSTNSFTLTPVPLFIVMGAIILRCGVAERFYSGMAVWLRSLPGGLLQSNIVACGVFSAVCGSSVATAGTIGAVAIPQQRKRGYDNRMMMGSLAAGGTLGNLIPPSIVMIIYCSLVDESVVRLMIAGVVPGIVLALMYMIYIATRSLLDRSLVPVETEVATMARRVQSVLDVAPLVGLIVFIMGSIYLGWATATEAAAVGIAGSLIIAALYRGLSWESIKLAHIDAVRTTCMVMFIVIAAQVFSHSLVHSGVTRGLTEFVISLNLSDFQLFLVIVALYLVLGTAIEGVPMMFLTLPLLYPIVVAAGFDLAWFGIVVVVLVEFALISPPIGLNLAVLHGLNPGRSYSDVVNGSVPYMGIMVLFLILLWAAPEIVLWLPNQMSGGAQ